MVGITNAGITEAALAAEVEHWAAQGLIHYLGSRGPANANQIAAAVGCSRSLVLKQANALIEQRLIRVAGKKGNSHTFDLTPDGIELAAMIREEIGDFRSMVSQRTPVAPGRPRPLTVDYGGRAQLEETVAARKATTNGHHATMFEVLDRMTLAEVKAMVETVDDEERAFLRAVVLGRTGLR